MDQALLRPLERLETSLTSLLQSLTTTTTYTSAPKHAQSLIEADDQLSSALLTLHTHQQNHNLLLSLQSERDTLRQQLKSTIFKCADFKKSLAEIDRRIVDESDTEDDEEVAGWNGVDYKMLVEMARRIGKGNATSSLTAEREVEQRWLEANRERYAARRTKEEEVKVPPTTNGLHTGADPPVAVGEEQERPTTSQSSRIHELAQRRLDEVNASNAESRWRRAAPYPEHEILRKGLLGKLEMMRENDGDEAMEAYVEKLVKDSELGQKRQVPPAMGAAGQGT